MTDDSYPASWAPRGINRQTGPSPDVIEALLLAIDSYIASLPERNSEHSRRKRHDHDRT